ncbi:2-octaprenyl-6-methoxyphenol hydroxylase [Litoreibacter ascidiaceicola]|uniref:2-octaprenyl-6-methoxyphenol hydroxylase n=1 Tax=Litoreibacter ascidiaceicola TaxID=1486859 RepID=A0A1M4T600_9RHOB|nr:UbiH/UbiF family hydroxylase [Litoreibacter ascidiaceicola]SHE39747.1 2-octaprenyl-6-methoxyphenol hydroxylase [Litoreibacter ascidiaceicola]
MSTDIFISGGGVAGLTAACLFGSQGFNVTCVDPAPPITERDADGADLRSTAFLQPAIPVLEMAGVWHKLSPHAMPLQTMRIVDAGGEAAEPRATRDFNASDISELPFGWNLPNWLIRRELVARLAELSNVEFLLGTACTKIFTRSATAKLWLSDGTTRSAQLVIAADGRNSLIRESMGIDVKTTRYGQKALAFAVTHPIPHNNVSTEIHRTGGPFTLVPLPDHDGQPSSAIVWMEKGPEAARLCALSENAFNQEMSERSCHLFGPLTLASKRTLWPIISQIAERFSAERVALIAEAAHVAPPIGAQGLNMSLTDLSELLELARLHPLGSKAMLDAYDKKRRLAVKARVMGIDLLNRTSMSQTAWIRDLRSAGIGAIHDAAPIRKSLMKLGLGAR